MDAIFFESYDDYEEYVYEASMGKHTPFKELFKKLRYIRKASSDEYDGEKEVKKFVDKHYDDLEDLLGIVDGRMENITAEKVSQVGAIVSSLALLVGVMAFSWMTADIPMFATLIVSVIGYLISVVSAVVAWVKKDRDNKLYAELRKVRTSFMRLQKKVSKDKELAKKIDRVIDQIDECEESFKSSNRRVNDNYGNSINVVESVYDSLYYAIQDQVNKGKLTVESAEYLNDVAYDLFG